MNRQRSSGRERLVLYLERFIHVGLYLVLLSPLLVWSGFLFPHLTAKVLGFQVLVELVVAAFLIMILLKKSAHGKKPNPLRTPLIVILAAFFAYSLLTAIFGVDLNRSLWGFIDRQDGLVLLLHFLAWTVVLVWFHCSESDHFPQADARHPGNSRRFHSYLYFSFWVSVVVALTALSDTEVKFEGIARSILAILASPTRISGVFGNPIFLGSYLLFHFFFGFYFLLEWMQPGSDCNHKEDSAAKFPLRHRATRYVHFSGVVLGMSIMVFIMLAGQTRGVILALVVGLAVIGAMFVFGPSTPRFIKVAGVIFVVCVILAAAVTWQYRDSPRISRIPILQRLTRFSSTENLSTFERLLSWGSGLRGSLDHPLLGWGYNNAYYALNKYYDPRHIKLSPFLDDTTGLWFDKSHNFFIDLLIERGILGVLLYCLLLGVIGRSLWRLADRRLAICMAGALISYLVSNAVAFDNFGSLFGSFLAMACIASVGNPEPTVWLQRIFDQKRNVSKLEKKKFLQAPPLPAFRMLAVLLLLAVSVYLQVEIAIANHEYAAARTAFTEDPAKGVSMYVDAFGRFSPYAGREKLTCASLILNSVLTKKKSSQSFDAGPLVLRYTGEALSEHPQDAASYVALNDMYNSMALYLNPEFAVQAEAFGKKALEMVPHNQEAIYNLSRTYVIRNEPARAVELNKRMLQDADFPIGHWYLGLSLLQNKQLDEAKKEIRKAKEMGYQLTAKDFSLLKGLLTEKDISELTAGK